MPRHYGAWSASSDQGHFNLTLNPENSFKLVEHDGEESTELSGTYSISEKRLELNDASGFVVETELHFVDGNKFELTLNDETLVFVRL